MARRNYLDMPLATRMKRLMRAHVDNDPHIKPPSQLDDMDNIGTLEQRVERLFGFVNKKHATHMIFFVMYDIESNKVRRHIAKYLLHSGCLRIQRSIFIANLTPDKVAKIKNDLAEVQACYDNHDSILVVPISSDLLQAMKVIGRDINVDIVTRKSNTLFF